MIDKEHWKELAELCDSSGWVMKGEGLLVVSPSGQAARLYGNARDLIAYSTPARVLELLAENARLRVPMAERYADILRIQRAEAETGDPYMLGLYNGMHMMCANIDGTEFSPMERATPAAAAPQQAVPEWKAVTRAGQVKEGDKLRFTIGDKSYSQRAKEILHAGTGKEEVIYDMGRNFYFITSMVINGGSNHKNVEVLAAPAPAEQPQIAGAAKGGNTEYVDSLAFSWNYPASAGEGKDGGQSAAAVRDTTLEEAAKLCDVIGQKHRDQYKGRGAYASNNPRRADPHCDGCADGAWECEEAIEALRTQPPADSQNVAKS